MSHWVVLHSVTLTYSGLYGSYGVSSQSLTWRPGVLASELEKLKQRLFCILWSNVRPTYGLRHVASPPLGPSVGKVSGTPFGTDG